MNFLTRAANYVAKLYNDTPPAFRWLFWLFLIIYFLSPVDFVPDLIPGFLGRLDDLLLLAFAFWAFDRAKRYRGFFQEARERRQESARGERAQEASGTSRASGPPRSPHEVLGVAANASRQEIKSAYRRMLGMYHPDKFTHLGPEFEATARERTQAIIDAYNQLA